MKPLKIIKEDLFSKYDMGGLNRIDLTEFDMSLNLTWIRKTITEVRKWADFAREKTIDRPIS